MTYLGRPDPGPPHAFAPADTREFKIFQNSNFPRVEDRDNIPQRERAHRQQNKTNGKNSKKLKKKNAKNLEFAIVILVHFL